MVKGIILLLTILFSNFIIGQEKSSESVKIFDERKYDSIVKSLNYKGGDKITVYTQFKINENGEIVDISARGPHKIFEEKAIGLVKDLPKMEPEKLKGKPIGTKFTLPITLVIETKKERIKRHKKEERERTKMEKSR
ncbi:MAG: energy transducer TonB [Flavobacteriaceae bacterium]|nr:energy transducer TonB [Flavobacteriaceae bacterium]